MSNDVTQVTASPISAMTTEDLRAELSRALEVTARHLAHLAAVWRELERRGEDMSGLRTGLWAYMPLIASGDVRPELVVQYAGHATLLRRLAGLRLEDQDRLLQDNTVPLIEYQEDGKFTERRVPITHLKSTQIAQVISDHLRSPDEQRRAAAGNARRMRRRSATTADRITELAQAMGQPKGRRVALTVTLTDAESEALAAAQARSGVPMTKLIRAMLLSSGLLNHDQGFSADVTAASRGR